MTNLQISFATFLLAILTIGMIYVILEGTISDGRWWKAGQAAAIAGLSIGVTLIFVPGWNKYSALCGMGGVACKVLVDLVVRYKRSSSLDEVRHVRRNTLIVAGLFVLISSLVGGSFLVLVGNQNRMKNQQDGMYDLLVRIERACITLIVLLEREHHEKQLQAAKDSVIRAKIINGIEGVKGQVGQSLQNDSDVKRALRRVNSKTTSPAIIITNPRPRQIPQSIFPVPDVDRVKPPPKARGYGYATDESDSTYYVRRYE